MIKGWDNLEYFNYGEWDVVKERLQDRQSVCPSKYTKDIFKGLTLTPFTEVKVVILGQDPYPNKSFSTGVAFSIPKEYSSLGNNLRFPPTLDNFFKEYTKDLGYSYPTIGNLESWSNQGVLLINAIPTCDEWKSMSHDWNEWHLLTTEIINKLSAKGDIVFVFLGSVARRWSDHVDTLNNDLLEYSHPSPRGSLNSKTPFLGSRMFSTINAKLVQNLQEPIDWRLP